MGPFDHLTPGQREQFREAHAQRKIAAADLASRMDRGTCPVCERSDITINKDWTLRVHGSKQGWPPSNCNGSGRKPKEG